MKNLTSFAVCGRNIDLAGRIVKLSANEYSAHTKVTFYSPETRGSEGQGASDFRTEKVLAYDYIVKVNASHRVQNMFYAERNQ